MDNVYWYYRLEWCFFFFLIKTKQQPKKKGKKLKPRKNTKLERFCLYAEKVILKAGSIQELLPKGLVPQGSSPVEEDGAVGPREGWRKRDTSDVDCTTHTQLLLTVFLLLFLAFFPFKKISCINKCSKFVMASGFLSLALVWELCCREP